MSNVIATLEKKKRVRKPSAKKTEAEATVYKLGKQTATISKKGERVEITGITLSGFKNPLIMEKQPWGWSVLDGDQKKPQNRFAIWDAIDVHSSKEAYQGIYDLFKALDPKWEPKALTEVSDTDWYDTNFDQTCANLFSFFYVWLREKALENLDSYDSRMCIAELEEQPVDLEDFYNKVGLDSRYLKRRFLGLIGRDDTELHKAVCAGKTLKHFEGDSNFKHACFENMLLQEDPTLFSKSRQDDWSKDLAANPKLIELYQKSWKNYKADRDKNMEREFTDVIRQVRDFARYHPNTNYDHCWRDNIYDTHRDMTAELNRLSDEKEAAELSEPMTVPEISPHIDGKEKANIKFEVSKTPLQLKQWGRTLSHCIGSYRNSKTTCLMAITVDGDLKYTAELSGWHIRQIYGKHNSQVKDEHMKLIRELLNECQTESMKPKKEEKAELPQGTVTGVVAEEDTF